MIVNLNLPCSDVETMRHFDRLLEMIGHAYSCHVIDNQCVIRSLEAVESRNISTSSFQIKFKFTNVYVGDPLPNQPSIQM